MAVSLRLPPIFHHFQLPLLILNNVFALALGPQRQFLRVSITLPLLILLIAQSLYYELNRGWSVQYGVESFTMTMVLHYVDWILLKSPDKEGWYKIQYGKKHEQEGDKSKASNGKPNGTENVALSSKNYQRIPGGAGTTFWSRMWWGIRLAATNRYVGWSQQVKNVHMEVPSDYPRLHYIARKSGRLLLLFVAHDIVKAYVAACPYGTYLDLERSGEKPHQHFPADAPFSVRLWYTWVNITLFFLGLELISVVYSIVSVMFGLANPRDCPSAFGYLRDLWSMRQAWSAVWHQLIRRICNAPSVWLAREVLGLKKGSFGSKYVQLFGTFGVSGFLHAVAAMLVNRSLDDDGAMRFFLTQAAIIFVEDHVIDFGKRMGLKDSWYWRALGFLWVVFSFTWNDDWFKNMIARGIWVGDRTVDIFGIGPK